tara:strand:+ start:2932 stop:3567 length:636 start_codon:yes stop_codon:yes gene_type:complete
MKDEDIKWAAEILREESIIESVQYIKQLDYKPMLCGYGWWIESCNQINTKGLCLEFGVFEGESINFLSNLVKDRTWYGFDSFEGLQENWSGGYHGKSWFNKKGEIPKVNNNVKIIKGCFKNTLPNFFKSTKEKISFMHIDCDTYESTKDVFNNINYDLFQNNSLILFDEYMSYWGWKENVFKAWQEYVKENNIKYEYVLFGKVQALVKIIK